MSEYQKILALDTALNGCSVGLYDSGRALSISRAEPMSGGQGERLVPLIGEVLAEAGLTFPELDAVLTTVGPGAFTGLRIGLSTAKSLGTALDIPVHGITTLQALALQYADKTKSDKSVAVLIETKREDFYFQSFATDGVPVGKPEAVPAPAILKLLERDRFTVIGDGIARFKTVTGLETGAAVSFEEGYMLLDAGFLATHLYEKIDADSAYTRDLTPVYLRGADVTSSKTPQRVLHSSR